MKNQAIFSYQLNRFKIFIFSLIVYTQLILFLYNLNKFIIYPIYVNSIQ